MRNFMSFLVGIGFYSLLIPALAQNKTITIANDDTADYQQKLTKQIEFHLPDLRRFKAEQSWRFWDINNKIAFSIVFDIYQFKQSRYKLSLILYSVERVFNDERPTYRSYYKKVRIDPKKTTAILNLFKTLNINTLPRSRFDTTVVSNNLSIIYVQSMLGEGVWNELEYANREHYTFKVFFNPQQDSVLKYFQDSVRHILNLKDISAWFIKRVPFEMFSCDNGFEFQRKILTDEEKRKYKLERDRYRLKHGL